MASKIILKLTRQFREQNWAKFLVKVDRGSEQNTRVGIDNIMVYNDKETQYNT